MVSNDDIEIRLFEASDALEIKLRPEDEHVRANPFFEAWAEETAKGAGFTGVRKSDGKILGCGGIKVFRPGCGEAWAIYSDEVGKYAKDARSYAIYYLTHLVETMGLHWLQCIVDARRKVNLRFAKSIGFEEQTLLKGYRPDGSDCYLLTFKMASEITKAMTIVSPPKVVENKIANSVPYLVGEDGLIPINGDALELEKIMMTMPQTELTPIHHFAKGLYCRELFIPKNTLISGMVHKQEHVFILFSGEHILITEDGPIHITGPYFRISPPGTKRLGFCLTDCIGMNIIATSLTDPKEIEDTLTCCSYEEYEQYVVSQEANQSHGDVKCSG